MKVQRGADRGGVLQEFDGVSLGDKRLDERVLSIVEAVATSPAASFPRQETTVAGREALYRFFSNPKVTVEKLLEAHTRATLERMADRPVVRLLHDSSSFEFSGDREGLGVILGNNMGFVGHFTLAIGADETREPLGIVAVTTMIHADAVSHRGLTLAARNRISKAKPREQKESSRWERQALHTSDLMPAGTRAIHVMDQEADDFVMLGELSRAGLHFVVRGNPKRRVTDGGHVKEVLEKKPSNVFRTVRLSTRAKKPRGVLSKTRTPRVERDAELEIRWAPVTLPRSHHLDYQLDEISVNAVYVTEPNSPEGEQAIEWMLYTSEFVRTLEDATAVVDHYRSRWVIEEYFKALKTGCSIEKRQLTSFDGLTRALALFIPIAWHMLALRHMARVDPDRTAEQLFDADQMLLLRALLERHRYALRDAPTTREVMLAVAALGGHIKNNGDPGWQVLGRGYTRFAEAEEVWRLARTYDQS
jgi:hypothetical protein